MLDGYPALEAITKNFDIFLQRTHPDFYGKDAKHPSLPIKPYKVIHDHLWGTNRFSWRELALIDSPIFQRLRGIHQTGLAYYVYPSAHHSRFEHSLGVATVASKVFDALVQRQLPLLETIAIVVSPKSKPAQTLSRLRAELRLAALLHDTGHSIHSHASERVYSELGLLKKASEELSSFVGKEKGSGEVISFCLAQTKSVAGVLERAAKKLIQTEDPTDFDGQIELDNVALLIVGRSKHPLLQFLGDIISGGFDADKLDYLLRDASAAGLPLRYDLERYLYTVFLDKDVLADGEGELQKLFSRVGMTATPNDPKLPTLPFKYFDTYRLRLPKMAMSTIEQIVICKLMLFSYIYHHQKVRAAEGMLIRLLQEAVIRWQENGLRDEEILELFLSASDVTLDGDLFLNAKDVDIKNYSYRVVNRILPREVYRFSPAFSHAEGRLIKDFFTLLEDEEKRQEVMTTLHTEIGTNLCKNNPALGATPNQALWNADVWVDVPKVPKFEDMSVLIGGGGGTPGYPISDLFPISQWTQAYQSHRFYVRIYAFSESVADVAKAAQAALSTVTGIKDPDFYKSCLRSRV